jgi:hypothetical protein
MNILCNFRYKYLISVNINFQSWLTDLAKILNAREPGWGDPSNGLIIGPPFHKTEYLFLKYYKIIINLV